MEGPLGQATVSIQPNVNLGEGIFVDVIKVHTLLILSKGDYPR